MVISREKDIEPRFFNRIEIFVRGAELWISRIGLSSQCDFQIGYDK